MRTMSAPRLRTQRSSAASTSRASGYGSTRPKTSRATAGCSDSGWTTRTSSKTSLRRKALAIPEDLGARGEVLDAPDELVPAALVEAPGLEAIREVDGL